MSMQIWKDPLAHEIYQSCQSWSNLWKKGEVEQEKEKKGEDISEVRQAIVRNFYHVLCTFLPPFSPQEVKWQGRMHGLPAKLREWQSGEGVLPLLGREAGWGEEGRLGHSCWLALAPGTEVELLTTVWLMSRSAKTINRSPLLPFNCGFALDLLRRWACPDALRHTWLWPNGMK